MLKSEYGDIKSLVLNLTYMHQSELWAQTQYLIFSVEPAQFIQENFQSQYCIHFYMSMINLQKKGKKKSLLEHDSGQKPCDRLVIK